MEIAPSEEVRALVKAARDLERSAQRLSYTTGEFVVNWEMLENLRNAIDDVTGDYRDFEDPNS